jgi:lipase chaperone LimK
MSPERELIEKLTGKLYAEWTQEVMRGGSRARRVLLYIMLKRQHPALRFDDVDFAWDELTLQQSKQEYDDLIAQIEGNETLSTADIAMAVDKLRKDQLTAHDDPGKRAELPIVE